MQPKLVSILGRLYYIDEFGFSYEIDGIPTIEVAVENFIGNDPSLDNCELTVSSKSSKVAHKLAKEHIKIVNRLNRHIRREKRIKEQARRAKLKWGMTDTTLTSKRHPLTDIQAIVSGVRLKRKEHAL